MTDDVLDGEPGIPAEPEPGTAPDGEAAGAVTADDPGLAIAAAGSGVAGRDVGMLKEVLEALVFVHRGILPPRTVREVLGEEFTDEEIAAGFAALKEDYAARSGAIVLVEVAGGYQLGTRTDLAPWIQRLDFYEHHRHLTRPTMETLAIVAYKQPVTRAEIEAIRGVNVERIVRNLLERKLVRILGHKDVPGKPMVLGTTREFLELFGLKSLADLPPLKEFVEPPSPEGIYEEFPAPPPGGGVDDSGGAGKDTAAAGAVVTMGQETEHGAELDAGGGEPATESDGGDPAADSNETV